MRENSPLQRIGLFVYLLEHEVGIAALFGCLDVPVGGHKRLFRRYVIAAEIKDPDASAGNHRKLLLVDQIVFPCMRKYRGNIGCDEITVASDSDDERTVFSHRKQPVGNVGEQHSERI